jgi:UDP-N-acetylmuramoyl-tripeptide--D-alanyl-D-alanine ligase
MTALWSIPDLMKAIEARPFGTMPDGISGISIDTRTLQPGEAFFAIRGDKFDGHDFVNQAMKAGAGVAVVSESRLVALGHMRIPLLVVQDVLHALEKLGIASRARSRAQIVAVTGSVGKTTTKEMLRAILSASGNVHASAASFNNHWGVPLTLARMPADTNFGVFEIGMNHAGEITPLVAMVRPHVALITTVAPAHLGNFDSIDGIARAKAEIFSGVVRGGYAVVNRDIKQYSMLCRLAEDAGIAEIRSFGTRKGADFRLVSANSGPDGSKVSAAIGKEKISYFLPLPGAHQIVNSLAALGAATLLGADLARSAGAFAAIEPEKGRGRRHALRMRGGEALLVDESYNANPASMEAALAMLATFEPQGRRIAVLGDMLELGESSQKLHRALAEPIASSKADLVYLAGPQMAALARDLPAERLGGHYPDAAALAAALVKRVKAGDVVMVKASQGLKFATIIETLLGAYPAGAAEAQ